jgi:hypothetical protein
MRKGRSTRQSILWQAPKEQRREGSRTPEEAGNQAEGLERCVGSRQEAQVTNQTTVNRSFLQRIVWYLYPELTGKHFSIDDIHSPQMRAVIGKVEKTFLPELDRMTNNTKKKGKHENKKA